MLGCGADGGEREEMVEGVTVYGKEMKPYKLESPSSNLLKELEIKS